MKTIILRVKKCGVMTTVQSDKAENGVLNKRTLVLQELGGKYENSYVVTTLGNLATIEFAEGELVIANQTLNIKINERQSKQNNFD